MNPFIRAFTRQRIAEVPMSSEKILSEQQRTRPGEKTMAGKGARDAENPEWTSGLRRLYDSVVEEPLPDSFKDLLAQLDQRG